MRPRWESLKTSDDGARTGSWTDYLRDVQPACVVTRLGVPCAPRAVVMTTLLLRDRVVFTGMLMKEGFNQIAWVGGGVCRLGG